MQRMILPAMKLPDINLYIGSPNEMAVDLTTGNLRYFDGNTPGGIVIPIDLMSAGATQGQLDAKVNLRDSGVTFCPLDDRKLVPAEFIDIEDHMNDPRNGHTAARKDGGWVNIDYPQMVSLPGSMYPVGSYEGTENLGEVPSSDLIDPSTLAKKVGLASGELNTSFEDIWIKFRHKGKILFVPKQSILGEVSWQALYEAGVVYSEGRDPEGINDVLVPQGKTLTLNGLRYRIRLLEGKESIAFDDISPGGYDSSYYTSSDSSGNNGSEWGKLFYNTRYSDFSNYDDYEIRRGYTYNWVQEHSTQETGERLVTGGYNLDYGRSYNKDEDTAGWRPVLELVDPIPDEGHLYETDLRSNTDVNLPSGPLDTYRLGNVKTLILPEGKALYLDSVEMVGTKDSYNYSLVEPKGFYLVPPGEVSEVFSTCHPGYVIVRLVGLTSYFHTAGIVYFDTTDSKTTAILDDSVGTRSNSFPFVSVSGNGEKAVIAVDKSLAFVNIKDFETNVTPIEVTDFPEYDFDHYEGALNHDGSLLLIYPSNTSNNSTWFLFDIAKWEFIDVPIQSYTHNVNSVFFTQEGGLLIVYRDNDIYSTPHGALLDVYDTSDWSLAYQATDLPPATHPNRIHATVREISNGRLLWLPSNTADGYSIRIYDMSDWTYTENDFVSDTANFDLPTVSYDLKTLVGVDENQKKLRVFNLDSLTETALTWNGTLFESPQQPFFSSDNTRVMFRERQGRDENAWLREVDLVTNSLVERTPSSFEGYTGLKSGVKLSSDGRFLAVRQNWTEAEDLVIFDLENDTILTTIEKPLRSRGHWSAMEFNTTGEKMYLFGRISSDDVNKFMIIDIATGAIDYDSEDTGLVFSDSTPGHSLAIDPTNTYLAFSHDDAFGGGYLGVLNLSTMALEAITDQVTNRSFYTATFSPDGKWLAIVTSEEGEKVLYSTEDWTLRSDVVIPSRHCELACFSADSTKVAILSQQESWVFDVETGTLIKHVKAPLASRHKWGGGIGKCARDSGIIFALTGGREFPLLFDVNRCEYIKQHNGFNYEVNDLTVSADGTVMVTYDGGSDNIMVYRKDPDHTYVSKPEYRMDVTYVDGTEGYDVVTAEVPKNGGSRGNREVLDLPKGVKTLKFICAKNSNSDNYVEGRLRGFVADYEPH